MKDIIKELAEAWLEGIKSFIFPIAFVGGIIGVPYLLSIAPLIVSQILLGLFVFVLLPIVWGSGVK